MKHKRLLAILIWFHMWYLAPCPIFSASSIFRCQNWCTLWWPERERASVLLNSFCTLRLHLCPSIIKVWTLNNTNSTLWSLWLRSANFTLEVKPLFHWKCKNWFPVRVSQLAGWGTRKMNFLVSNIFYPIWMWEEEYWTIISLQKTWFCSGS